MKKLLYLFLSIFFFAQSGLGESWTTVTDIPFPVSGAVGFEHGSLIYIIGGYSDLLFDATSLVQIYDPVNDKWEVTDILLTPRYGASVGVYDDQMYLYGGSVRNSVVDAFSLERWDLKNNESVELQFNYNFNRNFSASEIIDGKIYGFGGYPDFANRDSVLQLPYVFVYDIDSLKIDFISENIAFDLLATHQMSAVIYNKIYLLGGIFNGVLSEVRYFDTRDLTWNTLDVKLSTERYAGTASVIMDSVIVLIGGRNDNDHIIEENELFFLGEQDVLQGEQDAFQIEPLHVPRAEHITIKFGETLYVFGGVNEEGHNELSVEKLDIPAIVDDLGSDPNLLSPHGFVLNQNYPNPFNPETVIKYTVGPTGNKSIPVNLTVFDVLGRVVQTLVNKNQKPGNYKIVFNASNLFSGIYYYTIKAGVFEATRKMVIVR